MPDHGLFITLEGSEGVGKSTQLQMLAQHYCGAGYDVVTTREPGGTAGAEAIRALLMTGDADRWTDTTEALLFAAARADHVAKLIRPAIERGTIILCDRYVDSTRAYQGGAGGLSDANIMALHAVGSGGLLPHRTLLLDMPPDHASQRAAQRDLDQADRMGSKPSSYYDRVAAAFRTMAAAEPDRFRIINAAQDREEVHADCIAALADIIPAGAGDEHANQP
jgi:dTMP kinase